MLTHLIFLNLIGDYIKMKLSYIAVFSKLVDQPGYCVTVPDMPGVVTQGKDLLEATEMAIDAASGWVLDEVENNKSIPPFSDVTKIKLEENEFISLLTLDINKYAEENGSQAVRKNCTIPAWLNTLAEKAHINFSKVLQSALITELNI